VLHHSQDAEDAFQATFLVLAQKAVAIRERAALGSWLYGVALRVARKAKTARRPPTGPEGPPMTVPEPSAALTVAELQAGLDEELGRLPERYRAPLVLCYLQGQTQDEAARHLGWSKGTLRRRLDRGREVLRLRLARRGLTLGGALFGAALAESAAPAAVGPLLVQAAVRAGLAHSVGAAGGVSATVLALADGGAAGPSPRLKTALALALGLCVLGTGSYFLYRAALTDPADPPALADDRVAPPAPAAGPPVDRLGDPLPPGAVMRLGTTRLRNIGGVGVLAPAPDGKVLVASSTRHQDSIAVLDIDSGKRVMTLEWPETARAPLGRSVLVLAASPDGTTYAASTIPFGKGADSLPTVQLWEAATGKPLRAFGPGTYYSLAYSPDGRLLAALEADAEAAPPRVWQVSTGEELPQFSGDRRERARADAERRFAGLAPLSTVTMVFFAQDGKTLASHTCLAGIRLWDVAGGDERPAPEGARQAVLSAALPPGARWLAAVKNDFKTILLWDLRAGGPPRELRAPNPSTSTVTFSADGGSLIAVRADEVQTWDPAERRLVGQVRLGRLAHRPHAFTPDLRTLAVAHYSELYFLDTATGGLKNREGHDDPVSHLAFSADGRFIATGIERMTGSEVRLWEAKTGKLVRTFPAGLKPTASLAFSPTAPLLAWSGESLQTTPIPSRPGEPPSPPDPLQVRDVTTGAEVPQFARAAHTPGCVAFSADGQLLALGGRGELRLYGVATGREMRRFPIREIPVTALAFSRTGLLAAGYGSAAAEGEAAPGEVTLWNVASGAEAARFSAGPGVPRGLAFSPDGGLLAVQGAGVAQVREVGSGALVAFPGPPSPGPCAFSADGSLFVVGQRVHDVATRRFLFELTGHDGPIRAVAFAPDGRTLVTGSDDATALVWDVPALLSAKRAAEPPGS
jgi:RNA polymerase sigma factor (sigma-70 family)